MVNKAHTGESVVVWELILLLVLLGLLACGVALGDVSEVYHNGAQL